MNKAEFLAALRTERAEWNSLLAQVDEARMTEPGVAGEWSVKDVIAHIAWHEREMIGLLQARALVGSDLWSLPLHERNAAIFQLNQARALDEVLAEARQASQQFWEAVQTLSDEELADPRKFRDMPDDWLPWKLIAENSFEHYHDHLPDLRAWLEKTKPASQETPVTSPDLPQSIIDDFVGNAHGNFARVKELLEQYPQLLNANASWNEHAIEAASQVGSVEIANYLLAAGAPTSICTEAMLGHLDKVKAYLDSDPAQANAKGAHGISALYHAVIHANEDIAELLLSHGADVNAGAGGSPAIHGAVMFNRPEMVEWLLARGADANLKNYEDLTPLTAANKQGRAEIAELLRQRGAKE